MSRKSPIVTISKEDAAFKEALKLYEAKNYKKALKNVEAILKKNSNYADGYSLKALILYFMNEKAESEIYVKKALDKNANSPIVNHILGILRRNQLNYEEAAYYFENAMLNGSANKQIWRDLSTMQSQTRDYKKLVHSRAQYLEEALGYRANWTGLAIAHHLNGDYAAAEKVLSKFEILAKGKLGDAEMYENSELQLYKNEMILNQDLNRGLLDLNELNTFDKLGELEKKGEVLILLNKLEEASKVYRQLLKRNPDNIEYYKKLEVCLKTNEASPEKRLRLYKKLQKFYPRSDPARYLPLTFLTGDLFKQEVEEYVLSQLKRDVPGAFTNVKPLYKCKEKSKVIEEIVLKYFSSLDKATAPTNYVWCAYFLCQHFLYLKDLDKSFEYINEAIKHTPTLVELYILKARVLKHLNRLDEASEVMNEGRLIDLQDRFINSKCVKYYLRNNDIENAVKVVSLFTKNDKTVNGVFDLHIMQANWFLIESAEAYYRLFKKEGERRFLALSMKRFHGILKIFNEFFNDQVDFHSFCLRKGTARAYIEMIKWEDHIYNTPVFNRTVEGAAKIYFQLYDELEKAKANKSEGEEEVVGVKKLDKKAKKEQLAKQKALESEKMKCVAYENDDDVFGEKLISVSEPLKEFQELFFNKFYQQNDGKLLLAQDLNYKLQFKLGKTALSLQSLIKLKNLTNNKYYKLPSYLINLKVNSGEGISKVLADKGIEKNFSEFDINKLNDYLTEFYSSGVIGPFKTVLGLVEVLNLNLEVVDKKFVTDKIDALIGELEPIEKAQVGSYK